MKILPTIDRPRHDRHVDGNLRGELLTGVARQSNFGGTELGAQKSLLKIDWPYRFREEEIDGHSRVGLSKNPGEMLLDGLRGHKRRIAEFEFRDLQRCSFDANFLHVAFDGVCNDCVLERNLQPM